MPFSFHLPFESEELGLSTAPNFGIDHWSDKGTVYKDNMPIL